MANERVCVLYCGSSLTQQLYDKLTYLRTIPILLPSDVGANLIQALQPSAIIITGSPQYVNDPRAPKVDPNIYNLGIPILGLCYGMQVMARDLGGTVKRMPSPEKEITELTITEPNSILYQDFAENTCYIWMVHICKVTELPVGFVPTSRTKVTEYASMENPARRFYATQYHPEHKTSQTGTAILWNFLHRVAGCTG